MRISFQVVDGWFVHFFAPKLRPRDILNKRIIFVLDVSGSMSGEKLNQTKVRLATYKQTSLEDGMFQDLAWDHFLFRMP